MSSEVNNTEHIGTLGRVWKIKCKWCRSEGMSPRQPRTGSNGKTKVVWGLELPAAFICLELIHCSLERWDKIKKGMKGGRERGNKSMEENINRGVRVAGCLSMVSSQCREKSWWCHFYCCDCYCCQKMCVWGGESR